MKKIIIILSIALLLVALYGVDRLITNSYDLQIVSMDPQPVVADGKSPVTIVAQLTRNGQPVEGHTLYILPQRGSFYSTRVLTDARGYATFIYYPYLANSYIEAKPVSVEIFDEDNSIFIYVPVTHKFEIALSQPEEQVGEDSGLTMDDIFGE